MTRGRPFGLVTRFTSFVAVDTTRRVGDGDPDRIDQLLEAPEGVDVEMAGGGESHEYAPAEAFEAALQEQVYGVQRGRGCGCRSAGPTDTRFWAFFVGAIAVLFARRRHSGVRSTA